MEEEIMFRAQFVVAWPIWAGGYPTQTQALLAVEQGKPSLARSLADRLRTLLGAAFEVRELHAQIGAHAPMSGLWPSELAPNSVQLVAVVSAPPGSVPNAADLAGKVVDAVEDLAGLVSAFAREHMPGARQGANLYEVTTRWDPGPALSYLESGQRLQDIASVRPATDAAGPAAPSRRTRGRVFVSYAHRDARWLTRLQVHLMPLSQDHGIDLWDDTKIESGADWRTELDGAMRSAGVAVLLISADFLASEFIRRNELPPLLAAAQERGALVLPLIVAPSMFLQTPQLNRYQAVNDPRTPLVAMSKGRQEQVLNATAVRIMSHFAGE